jgi:predicted kinase
VTRLIHLNGPPGIGKSTIGRLHAAANPGVLNCDIDLLRTLIGGWESDFPRAGALIRPAAVAMISAYLSGGHDVVLPQLIVRAEELRRFEAAARDADASFHEIVLMCDRDAAVARFRSRPDGHASILAAVEAGGGDQLLRGYYDDLVELVAQHPDAVLVTSTYGAAEETYAAVRAALASE